MDDMSQETPDAVPAIGVIIKAAHFSADRHRNQRRKDAAATPYINHPLAVASILANEGAVIDQTSL